MKYIVIITEAHPDYKRPYSSNTISQFNTMEEVEEYKQSIEREKIEEYVNGRCNCVMEELCVCECTCGCDCKNMLECDGRYEHKDPDQHQCGSITTMWSCPCPCSCTPPNWQNIWESDEYNDWVYSDSYMDMLAISCEVVEVE